MIGPTISPSKSTTALDVSYIQPIFISPNPFISSLLNCPPFLQTSRPRGVVIIDHSVISTPSKSLSRNVSHESIETELLITPENYSPLTQTIILPKKGSQIDHPSEEDDNNDDDPVEFDDHPRGKGKQKQEQKSTPSVEIPRVRFDETSEWAVQFPPTTSFGKGEMIYHDFDESRVSISTTEDQISPSESSRSSSIISPSERATKIGLYEYWEMVDKRLRHERNERLKERKFSIPNSELSYSRIKVKDWLVRHRDNNEYNQPRQSSARPNEMYTTLSPNDFIRVKPLVIRKDIISPPKLRPKSESEDQQAIPQLSSISKSNEERNS